jgi:flavorubredoxin
MQVTNALKKVSTYDIKKILPLHGPIVENDKLNLLLNEYTKWASYNTTNGVTIVYSSVYGGTKAAAEKLAKLLNKEYKIFDLARCDIHQAIAYAFEYKNLVIASMTYNNGLFPHTESFLHSLAERGYKNHHISIIENGTWGPQVNKLIKAYFENNLKDNLILNKSCKILSRLDDRSNKELEDIALEINND